MLERLDFWLAVFTLGALAYWELRLDRFIVPIVRGVIGAAGAGAEEVKRRRKLRSRPVRGALGRFDGSLPATAAVPDRRSEVEPRSLNRSALESPGTTVPDVPSGTISSAEIALIGLRLGQGMSPSSVAKSLPGYSARKYQQFIEKVEKVQADLAEVLPSEEVQEAAHS